MSITFQLELINNIEPKAAKTLLFLFFLDRH